MSTRGGMEHFRARRRITVGKYGDEEYVYATCIPRNHKRSETTRVNACLIPVIHRGTTIIVRGDLKVP